MTTIYYVKGWGKEKKGKLTITSEITTFANEKELLEVAEKMFEMGAKEVTFGGVSKFIGLTDEGHGASDYTVSVYGPGQMLSHEFSVGESLENAVQVALLELNQGSAAATGFVKWLKNVR